MFHHIGGNSVQVWVFGMKIVKTTFIVPINYRKKQTGYSYNHSHDIYQGVELIVPKVSPSDFDIVFEHDFVF